MEKQTTTKTKFQKLLTSIGDESSEREVYNEVNEYLKNNI